MFTHGPFNNPGFFFPLKETNFNLTKSNLLSKREKRNSEECKPGLPLASAKIFNYSCSSMTTGQTKTEHACYMFSFVVVCSIFLSFIFQLFPNSTLPPGTRNNLLPPFQKETLHPSTSSSPLWFL